MTIELNDLPGCLMELRHRLAAGEEVTLTDAGRTVGRLVPAEQAHGPEREPRVFDMHPGAFEPGADFDAPLPDSFWLGEQ